MNTKRRSLLVITAQVSRPSGPGLGIRLRKIGKIQWLPLLPHFLTKLGEPLTSEKKNIGSARKVAHQKELPFFGGRITLHFLHINTLAHPAGSAWSRRDNQSMRDRCCLALRSGKGFKFFLITIANVDSAGRMTFFPKTTFLHKTGALRNVVNETLRLRKLFLKMTTKIFLSIC